ncbi:MAG: hypothetical protein ABSB97_06170 [Thermoplasmata archaeon]|jgi:hypothetical protein
MALALRSLPKYLVLAPTSSIRLEMHLEAPACEIDVSLNNPRPGRSFVLLIGHRDGPFVQRVRLAGRARVYFDPQAPGDYVLLLANPDREPLVLRLRARAVGTVSRPAPAAPGRPAGRQARRSKTARPTPRTRRSRKVRRRASA